MGVAVLLLVSLLWGSSFIAIKIAAGDIGAVGIAAGRLVVAAALLSLAAAALRASLPSSVRVWGRLLALSCLGQMAPFFCLGLAGQLTSSSNAAMMMGAAPLLTLLFGRFFESGDAWHARLWIGLAIGFAGVMIALGRPDQADATTISGDWAGKAAALLAAAGYALGALISRSLREQVPLTMTVATTMTISAVAMSAVWIALNAGDFAAGMFVLPGTASLVALGLLGAANTALAYFVYFWLVRREGATFASLNNYLVPVLGVLLGTLVLDEPFRPAALAGLALILGGIALIRLPRPQVAMPGRQRD
jgi:drug/metabolite transporter (DMT)-like permease